jgi:hypothetical protein
MQLTKKYKNFANWRITEERGDSWNEMTMLMLRTPEIFVRITINIYFYIISRLGNFISSFPRQTRVSQIPPSPMHIANTCLVPFTLRLILAVIEPRFFGLPARSLVSISTDILQLTSVSASWINNRFVSKQVCVHYCFAVIYLKIFDQLHRLYVK